LSNQPDQPSQQRAARVLVLHYSQTGQLSRVLESVVAPLRQSDAIEVVCQEIEPLEKYPFPWPFIRFINTFPEASHDVGCPVRAMNFADSRDFDLVILGYQVWFLSPSIPITGFLQSADAQRLLNGKPVVTVIACRNMWLMAQEKIKGHLSRLGAKLIGNIALIDKAGTAASFLSTPLWVLTGRKGPFPLGIPAAGVGEEDIVEARRFGKAIEARLLSGEPLDETLLQGLGAVTVNEKLIVSEKVAARSFYLWGKLFRALGGPDAWLRKPLTLIYAVFLLTLILTVVPLTALLKKLVAPFTIERTLRQKRYFSAPSGEERIG
jgi:hypothetical protein